MKNTVTIVLCLFLSLAARSQQAVKIYYSAEWEVTSAESAFYYRLWEKKDNLYEIHDYYISGKPLLSGYLSALTENFWENREGHYIYYNAAKAKTGEGNFVNGKMDGMWKYYNPSNGRLFEEVLCKNGQISNKWFYKDNGHDTASECEYIGGRLEVEKRFNSNRKLIYLRKNNLVTEYYNDGKIKRKAEYRDTTLVFESCYDLKGNDTACTKRNDPKLVEKMPVAGFGMGEYLSNNVHYPEPARLKSKTGKVNVEFVVLSDGSIAGVIVTKGTYPAIDEEARRVIDAMAKWQPGTQNGKAINVMYTQPITFTLD